MKEFSLVANVTISIYTMVEAETLEEAISISKDRSIEKFNYGDGEQIKEVWVSDDFDGEPMNIEEE